MTALILYLLLWLSDNRNFDSITKSNERKVGAERYFEQKQYGKAAELYRQIAYGSMFSEPSARLNMAHSYFLAGKYKHALPQYKLLTKVSDKQLASVAYVQSALIYVSGTDTASALLNLKEALRLNPGNDKARIDYTILKNSFSGMVPKQSAINEKKKEPTQNEETAAGPPPPASHAEVEENAKREQLLSSLKVMNMSEDQARAILDAMKSNESQYIYQLRRKQFAKQPAKQDQIEW